MLKVPELNVHNLLGASLASINEGVNAFVELFMARTLNLVHSHINKWRDSDFMDLC